MLTTRGIKRLPALPSKSGVKVAFSSSMETANKYWRSSCYITETRVSYEDMQPKRLKWTNDAVIEIEVTCFLDADLSSRTAFPGKKQGSSLQCIPF